MEIIELTGRNSEVIQTLLNIWESSVKATHLFLSDDEVNNIKQYVPLALKEIPHLLIAENENGNPVGFMGIANQMLEMLFIADEQNPLAKGFYEYMGFAVYKRTASDEQGNPYPLLYMKRI